MVQEDTCSTTSLLEFGKDFALTTPSIFTHHSLRAFHYQIFCGRGMAISFLFGITEWYRLGQSRSNLRNTVVFRVLGT